MKKHFRIIGALTAAFIIGAVCPNRASAQVSSEDFNALKKVVEQLGDKVQKLEQTHEQDQKAHEQDQQTIQRLQQQLSETGVAVTNAQQTADTVAKAQSAYPAPGSSEGPLHNFTMVGDAETQFGKSAGQHAAFVQADFAPIFLFRAGDNVLFESGFDFILANNATMISDRAPGNTTTVNLSFATLDYMMNDHLTLEAGELLLPLGTYSERSAGWLNKIPDDPLARDTILPGVGVGVELRGALALGESGQSLTYAAYAVNGPSSGATNSIAAASALDLGGNVGNTGNWHANPSAGGRVGWFYPWKPHHDFELGVSGQTGEWSDSGNRHWSALVVDAALHLGPNIELKGEDIHTWVGSDDLGTIRPDGWWVQGGYKLAGLGLELPYINSFELVGRYDNLNDALGTKTDRYTAGLVYYLSSTFLFEGDYEWLRSHGPAALPPNQFIVQLSYGF